MNKQTIITQTLLIKWVVESDEVQAPGQLYDDPVERAKDTIEEDK